jgi:hypothetical protein
LGGAINGHLRINNLVLCAGTFARRQAHGDILRDEADFLLDEACPLVLLRAVLLMNTAVLQNGGGLGLFIYEAFHCSYDRSLHTHTHTCIKLLWKIL